MSPARPFRLVGQTGAALGAATGQDLAAVSGSHSLAEAVDLGAVQLLGLIGTFRCHVETPPVRIPVTPGDDTYSTPPRRADAVNEYHSAIRGAPNSIQIFFKCVNKNL